MVILLVSTKNPDFWPDLIFWTCKEYLCHILSLPDLSDHYDFNTDKVCNSLRIQVLVDTCAMRHLNYRRTLNTTLYPSDGIHMWMLIANLFRLHKLNARLTENAMALFGASTNSWLKIWSGQWKRNLVSLHCQRCKQWFRDRFVWRLECGVELPRMWSTWDQKSNGTGSQKQEKRPSMLNHRESG